MENKAPPLDYSPEKKYERKGECNHCGMCCFGCKCQQLTTTRELKEGDPVLIGQDLKSTCTVHEDVLAKDYTDRYIARGCQNFPHHPLSTPALCGFYWVEVV